MQVQIVEYEEKATPMPQSLVSIMSNLCILNSNGIYILINKTRREISWKFKDLNSDPLFENWALMPGLKCSWWQKLKIVPSKMLQVVKSILIIDCTCTLTSFCIRIPLNVSLCEQIKSNQIESLTFHTFCNAEKQYSWLGEPTKLRNTDTIPFNVSYTAKFKPIYGAIP